LAAEAKTLPVQHVANDFAKDSKKRWVVSSS